MTYFLIILWIVGAWTAYEYAMASMAGVYLEVSGVPRKILVEWFMERIVKCRRHAILLSVFGPVGCVSWVFASIISGTRPIYNWRQIVKEYE